MNNDLIKGNKSRTKVYLDFDKKKNDNHYLIYQYILLFVKTSNGMHYIYSPFILFYLYHQFLLLHYLKCSYKMYSTVLVDAF